MFMYVVWYGDIEDIDSEIFDNKKTALAFARQRHFKNPLDWIQVSITSKEKRVGNLRWGRDKMSSFEIDKERLRCLNSAKMEEAEDWELPF